MKQALVPVDEDGLEPQVCVIEVCMIPAFVATLLTRLLKPARQDNHQGSPCARPCVSAAWQVRVMWSGHAGRAVLI